MLIDLFPVQNSVMDLKGSNSATNDNGKKCPQN